MPKSKTSHLAEFSEEEPTQAGPKTLVPNKFPSLTGFPYRIAIVGEAPGKDEEYVLEPFVGMSGRLLSALLGKANIVREACFIGNVCQYRPLANEIARFSWSSPEIQSGIERLYKDLYEYKPNLVVCLGATALHVLKVGNEEPPLRNGRFIFPNSISDWRGSLFLSPKGWKCVAAHHPAACLRQYEWMPLLTFDLKKAATEGLSPSLNVPSRTLCITKSAIAIVEELERLRAEHASVSIDIEGYIDSMSCISVAPSKDYSFIVPFARLDGSSYWTQDEEVAIWRALANLLADPTVSKTLQNSLYDRFVLQYSYGCLVSNVRDDTMLKHHELYCELEKSLGFQCSLYTAEPFYKSDSESNDQDTFYRYCCRDSAVTMEISQKLDGFLKPPQHDHYRFNMTMLNPLLYMELRGIRYATDLSKKRLKEVNNVIYNLQYDLNRLAGRFLDTKQPRSGLLAQVRSIMEYKKDPSRPRKEFEQDYDKVIRILLGEGPLSKEEVGYIETTCDLGLNTKGGALKTYLYDTLKLPVQYHRTTKQPTTDYEALLKLSKKSDHPALRFIIDIGELRTRSQMLAIYADKDGRIRCGYNCVGTKTGRLTCYSSPTGSGYNLQTIPDNDNLRPENHPLHRGMRDLFLADEGYYMFQCDLKGSDGWTIGAHLNALGDPAMLDDLRFGIKPAARVAYMLMNGNGSLQGKSREEVKELLKSVKKDSWQYFVSKVGIWGCAYTMGPDLLANEILQESAGKVALSRNDVKDFHNAVHSAYRLRLWHEATARKIAKKPELVCDGGHTRRFFGRANEILGDVLSHEPQYITTRATNTAMLRLWMDPENRNLDGSLKIEPLHQVHDALIGQFRIEDTEWATRKIPQWFDNSFMIAEQQITIPQDGAYGESWGNLTKGVI